jgi:hypothetical protein
MDPILHKRYLDYRERHAYFGRRTRLLSAAEFEGADSEHRALGAKGEARNEEEQARFDELTKLLFRD